MFQYGRIYNKDIVISNHLEKLKWKRLLVKNKKSFHKVLIIIKYLKDQSFALTAIFSFLYLEHVFLT